MSQENHVEPQWVGSFTKDVKQHKDFPRLKTPLVFTAVIVSFSFSINHFKISATNAIFRLGEIREFILPA